LTEVLSDPSENGGFEFDSVIVQNIILENKAITDAIANTVVSQEAKKQAINEAEGLAAKEELPGRAQNTVRRERMEDMMNNLSAAQLLTMENSFKNAEAISLGNPESLFFNYELKNNKKRNQQTKEMEVTDEKK
jgi:regulator of protease activity HflC (stomatin/prohibitin superfamily)